jgi:hypothetical protein
VVDADADPVPPGVEEFAPDADDTVEDVDDREPPVVFVADPFPTLVPDGTPEGAFDEARVVVGPDKDDVAPPQPATTSPRASRAAPAALITTPRSDVSKSHPPRDGTESFHALDGWPRRSSIVDHVPVGRALN